MHRTSFLAALLVLLAPCGCSDVQSDKSRPVSKVIDLLKDMRKQLEKEGEEDEEVYEKMACWCETNDKEKTKAIADAEAKIEDLNGKIEKYTAASARLNTEIKNLEKEKASQQSALDKATAMREKELGEFNGEEKDMLESISALKAAIEVLKKHQSGSLLQVPQSSMLAIVSTLQREMLKYPDLLSGTLSRSDRQKISSFIQEPETFFDAKPTFKQSYAPQSGEIFGILSQMRETFESNLSASQKEELANQKAYDELKKAKEEQIAAAQEQIESKTAELAITDEKNVNAKEDVADTKESLAADEQFLMMLKEKCAMTDKEWEQRQKTRQLEIEAVSKALTILSSDDAHDLYTKTFNFMQVAAAEKAVRKQASQILVAASRKLNNPSLLALAAQVRLDAFTRVIAAIDDMIAQLLQQKADEIKHKDFCVEEFHQNQLETEKKEREKRDLIAKVEDLKLTIKGLTQEIEDLKAQIKEMQTQMKRAGEDREKENKEFQATIADQRATQGLLQGALEALEGFYEKQKAAFVQKQEPVGPAPPPGFDAYKKNTNNGGVMGMIQQIIDDARAMENEAIRSEEDAQRAYEEFVKETNDSIEANSNSIVDKSDTKSKAEADEIEASDAKEEVMQELEELSNYKSDLHGSCDFVLKNFEIRQTARDEEVDSLRQAKAILKGAK